MLVSGSSRGLGRRELLRLAALSPALVVARVLPAYGAGRAALLGCCATPEGEPAVAILAADLSLLAVLPLPGRGHGIAVSPDKRSAVVLSRRPGRDATVVDLEQRSIVTTFSTPEDRHFFGHGFFSSDGRTLYTTENDFDRPGSVLAAYDASSGYRRTAEMDTGGVGAHQAVLLADGKTAAVANGGIETHPDYPRAKLNLADMTPSLAYLRVRDGDIVEQRRLPKQWRQLSLRHLVERPDGSVWIGGQFEGHGAAPLLVRHERGRELELVDDPADTRDLRGYVGSIAAGDETIVITSPRGNRAVSFQNETGQRLETHEIADVCGAVRGIRGVVVSSGTGEVRWLDGTSRDFDLAWDNHLTAV